MAAIGLWGAILLGWLQGLTEFLPVSSSGHLVLAQEWIDVGEHPVVFDLILHVGTLAPALWFFRRDIAMVLKDGLSRGSTPWRQRDGVHLAWLVVVASVPTAVIGLLFEDHFEALFDSSLRVAPAFLVTSALLWWTQRAEEGGAALGQVTWRQAAWIGLAQGCAITPGISRSGSTIAVALLLGLRRDVAVKLSFLMSVPAISGALLLKLRKVDPSTLDAVPMLTGAVAAGVTGYFALAWLVAIVQRGHLHRFSLYLWFAAAAAVASGLYHAG